MSSSLWPHEPQHARPPCPSPTPGVHPNPRPLSRWCHPTISSSVVPFSSCPQSFAASGSFQMSALCIRWPKYWSFSFNISPSNEHPGLICFKVDSCLTLTWIGHGCTCVPHPKVIFLNLFHGKHWCSFIFYSNLYLEKEVVEILQRTGKGKGDF